jgi:hypothetical protein
MTITSNSGGMSDGGPLVKLTALDPDDLEVVSALLQDAVLKVGDIRYLKRKKLVVLTARRFDWQHAAGRRRGPYRRRLAGLSFARVLQTKAHNIRQDLEDGVLALLSISFTAEDPPAGDIVLTFSGGGEIRLEVECIEARLEDLGPEWETAPRPSHPTEPEGVQAASQGREN